MAAKRHCDGDAEADPIEEEVNDLEIDARAAELERIAELEEEASDMRQEFEKLRQNSEQSEEELRACKQALQSSVQECHNVGARLTAQAATTETVRKQLTGATQVCQLLIDAAVKGQKNGAYTLEEASTIYTAIKKLQTDIS